ncbi:unnamed protein product [Ambrosiozyma monospora]|uniref:Unnamed protein product n=1 Tax=Ambrosiozyma monospora TaxID=43982 RepID=A0A9W7DKK5_AMBMO|nr:unnamed protein product [Ambrosiozyma monospora]
MSSFFKLDSLSSTPDSPSTSVPMVSSSSRSHKLQGHGLTNNNNERKNIMKTITSTPLRFALLGPHRSSKSSIVSILSNQKSLENYYPTVQNSPTLFQFQPKNIKARALLDVNVSIQDLDELGIWQSDSFVIDDDVMNTIVESSKGHYNPNSASVLNSNSHSNSNSYSNLNTLSSKRDISTETEDILPKTLNYYDLDYQQSGLFNDDYLSPVHSSNSMASNSTGSASGNHHLSYFASVLSAANSVSYHNKMDTSQYNYNYHPPVTSPILLELIDSPGVTQDDLIPFLEKSLDSRLASDVLRNLISNHNGEDADEESEVDTSSRSRVKPLIVGSGISDLNGAIDGYLMCYSCVPESTTTLDLSPPAYSDVIEQDNNLKSGSSNAANEPTGFEAIEILKSLHATLKEAWKEYLKYYENWVTDKEFDVFSLNQTFKNLWKRNNNNTQNARSKSGGPNKSTRLNLDVNQFLPPIVIAVTHVDHELASPLLIEEGRKLAKLWGTGFVEVSCEFENWNNVEELMALMIRESIEKKKSKKSKSRLFSQK